MDLRARFVDMLPGRAIRLFAGPYVAGDSIEAALRKSRALADIGVAATIDVLGEDAASAADVEHYIALYMRLLDALAGDERFASLPAALRPSVSLKPSSFVVAPQDHAGMLVDPDALDVDACALAIGRVIAHAVVRGMRVTIDMENHQWTDLTLEIHRRQFAAHGDVVGTVLQSRLFRTERDVRDLPDGCRIRLCIGIYNEPASVARRSPAIMKAQMIPLAKVLFAKGVFVEFATHDLRLIDRFMREVVLALGIAPDRFETQTLMGVPRQRLIGALTSGAYFAKADGAAATLPALRRGIVHRLYVPFAEDWNKAIAYSRRRLRHSPNIFWTGLLNAPRVLYYAFLGK